MSKSDKLYKDSPTVERDENGTPAIGKNKTVGEDGSNAEMDKGGNDESHEAERSSMHRRHEEEQKAMHERHHKDMKEMHKRHEKKEPKGEAEKEGSMGMKKESE